MPSSSPSSADSHAGIVPHAPVQIQCIRGQRVILAADLAELYGVETRVLNQAVKRNPRRFPADFAFRLTASEAIDVNRSRSQSVILNRGQNVKYAPIAFTEHGAIMAAAVLNSARAVHMSVFVVRAFLSLRDWVADQAALAVRLAELEGRVGDHDHELRAILEALRGFLDAATDTPKSAIGFATRASP